MTEIIPGLQGDIPEKAKKGVPFVAGGYDMIYNVNREVIYVTITSIIIICLLLLFTGEMLLHVQNTMLVMAVHIMA
jgi:hypothetical protein